MSLVSKLGLLVAATGVAHFATPETFEPLTKAAFPADTREWVYRNGATEFAIGTALVLGRTRRLGILGLLAYLGFLGSRAAANR
jgi:uncharacterized membrane protein